MGSSRIAAALAAAAIAACAVTAPAAAQATDATRSENDRRNEATLEASFVRGTAGYARSMSDRMLVGIEVGFGFPQLDRTLKPATDEATGEPDFEEYLHVGVFVRNRISPNFEVDTGVRASIADLWSCQVSDCYPAPFAGGYIQPMVGGRRLKAGVRLTAGWINETEEAGRDGSTFTVGLAPLLIRYTLPW